MAGFAQHRPSLADRQAELKARLSGKLVEPVLSRPSSVQYHTEQHWAIPELASRWGMSSKTLRRIFGRETEGVIRVGDDKVTMFVSESAARRVYARLSRR